VRGQARQALRPAAPPIAPLERQARRRCRGRRARRGTKLRFCARVRPLEARAEIRGTLREPASPPPPRHTPPRPSPPTRDDTRGGDEVRATSASTWSGNGLPSASNSASVNDRRGPRAPAHGTAGRSADEWPVRGQQFQTARRVEIANTQGNSSLVYRTAGQTPYTRTAAAFRRTLGLTNPLVAP